MQNSERRIIITGGSGFIGSYLAKSFKKNDLLTIGRKSGDVQLDLSSMTSVPKKLADFEPNIIIHCAANPNSKYTSETVRELVQNNLLSTVNLLEGFDNLHFINISTVLVFNDYQKQIIGPKTVYGTTKLSCEMLANNYTKIKNIKVTNLRIPATVGPNLNHGVLNDVIKKIKNSNGEIELFGKEPGSYKPFLHLKDLSEIINDVISSKKYGTFTVGPDDNICVKNIAEEAMKVMNKEVKINWTGNSWPGDDDKILLKSNILPKLSSQEAVSLAISENINE